MSAVTYDELKKEFFKSKIGIIGLLILASLIAISIIAITTIPMETFKEWNNPSNWITYPKAALPSWVNMFSVQKAPEHKIYNNPNYEEISGYVTTLSEQFTVDFRYDELPNDFIYQYSTTYTGSPLLTISVLRPDGVMFDLLITSLPYSQETITHTERIFSTDEIIKKNLTLQEDKLRFDFEELSSEDIIFSADGKVPLKGRYQFIINYYSQEEVVKITDSSLIIGGKVYGLMGTDEIRRDLAVGLLWGTPLALFIGLAVAIGSVIIGLFYGVFAGYKGKNTDEALMRFNDVVYALPALPFLIILAVTISNNIFLIIGFLMMFGWVGVAKVSRSMALQIKTKGYVEAAKMMGQKESKIIGRHILPQLLPYAFASIAISVPAAITTEAGLSFLGLGDPSFPTWGQILHDASVHGAAARGLWWWILPPGLMIAITGLAFVFLGNALDSIANPKLKRQ